MKTFTCISNGVIAVVSAFNRGHAVKLLSKQFEEKELAPLAKDAVHEFSPEENGRKGNVVFLHIPPDVPCVHPGCKRSADFTSPEQWCERHWDEWWDCECAIAIEGEAGCETHSYMRE